MSLRSPMLDYTPEMESHDEQSQLNMVCGLSCGLRSVNACRCAIQSHEIHA